jgi:hypothetical protein
VNDFSENKISVIKESIRLQLIENRGSSLLFYGSNKKEPVGFLEPGEKRLISVDWLIWAIRKPAVFVIGDK